ncbi:MAG: sigma 54-interacting transcriptional regulator [Eubacteriaceae bacterium]|jgi:transcriptional regulator with PAS, ATPase and Fis domain|nr:sigma 54-interacting transcriptional regulator [Eubacteriaceae bacterium]
MMRDPAREFIRSQRLALIATYPKMSKIFMKVTEKNGTDAVNIFASFDDAVKKAKEIEPKVDAILSRGSTAAHIQDAVDIPVIFIPITPFDVLKVVHSLPEEIKEIAFLNYVRLQNIDDIEQMYGIKIYEYTFSNKDDIYSNINDISERGIKTVVGGNVAVKYAVSRGLTGIEVSSGEYAVTQAFNETMQILYEKRKEKESAYRLHTAFESLSEGIVVADQDENIVLCNPSAAKFLYDPINKPVPEKIDSVISDAHFQKVFGQEEPDANYIKKYEYGLIAASHRQIKGDGLFLGTVSTFEDVTKIQALEKQIRHEIHDKGFEARYTFEDILTNDKEMQAVKDMAAVIAETNASVLIEGESGTGKEMFAQGLHNASERKTGPFVAINCAAIPQDLLESELFGYEAGAFTGARKEGKKGMFELADRGTIFLDEIGEIQPALQARLLRVIQEREVMRVGGSKIIPIDVRIISATNHNLLERIKQDKFREDLYYRLAVFNLKIPPLRRRKNDISLLAGNFIANYNDGKLPKSWDKYLDWMSHYDWPGNIRELQNVTERIAVLSQLEDTHSLSIDEIIAAHDQLYTEGTEQAVSADVTSSGKSWNISVDLSNGLKEATAVFEREVIRHELNGGDSENAAEKLKIGKTTLWRKANYNGGDK